MLGKQEFDVLWIVVLARDKKNILDAAGDDELAIALRTEVAGVDKSVGSPARGGHRRILVITRAHIVAADENAADHPFRCCIALLIGNPDLAPAYRRADADQFHRVLRVGGDRPDHVTRAQGAAREMLDGQRGVHRGKRHGEARLGQAVYREHRIGTQLRGSQRCGELAAQVGGDWFGAVEDDPDRRQVERGGSGLVVRLQIVLVSEVGRTGNADPMLAGLGEPQAGPAHEKRRRHQPVVDAREQWRQVKSDEAHVVRQWHPRQARIMGARSDRAGDRVDVGCQIAVRQDHALRLAGGAGRELNERDVVGRRTMLDAGHRDVGDFVQEHRPLLEPDEPIGERVVGGERAQALEHLALGGKDG